MSAIMLPRALVARPAAEERGRALTTTTANCSSCSYIWQGLNAFFSVHGFLVAKAPVAGIDSSTMILLLLLLLLLVRTHSRYESKDVSSFHNTIRQVIYLGGEKAQAFRRNVDAT